MTDSVPETQPDSQPESQPDTPLDAQASSTSASSAASSKAAAPKQRSPVERAVVWGVIAVLVVVAVLEARARFGFKAAYDSLLDRIQEGEHHGIALAGPEVTDILKGRKRNETRKVQGLANSAVRVDIYHFGGILQKRTLYVYYGIAGLKGQPEVVSVSDRKAEEYVLRTTAASGSSTGKGLGRVDPNGQPGDRQGSGIRERPAGEKTKGTPEKKSTTQGTPESKKSKPAPKKSKPAPKKSKAAPPVKKKTKNK